MEGNPSTFSSSEPLLNEKLDEARNECDNQEPIQPDDLDASKTVSLNLDDKVNSLERSIRNGIPTNPTPPPFKLVIEGFVERKPTLFDDSTHSKVFAFAISLPTPVSSTFYSMPNDAPCLRGSEYWDKIRQREWVTKDNIGIIGLDRSVTELKEEAKSRTLSVSSKGDISTESSEEEIEKKWNERIRDMKLPPWISMSGPSSDQEDQIEGSRLEEGSTSTLQDCLKYFVQDKCRNNKYLIAPQSIYGWDQESLLRGLRPLIEAANKQNELSAEPITHLSLRLQLPPPLLHLKVEHEDQSSPLTILARLPASLENYMMLVASLLSLYTYWSNGRNLVSGISVALFAGSYFTFFFRQYPSIHNSIGLAWAMKGWIKTEFSSDLSERGVREKLILGGQAVPELKLLNGKWLKMAGMDEKSWIEGNKERISEAIRDRQSGDLDL